MFDIFSQSSDKEAPPESSSALSIIGSGSTMEGTLDLEADDLRVDGVLDGDVHTEGRVHVAQGGAIQGEIQAGSIRIAGDAEGVFYAKQELVLLAPSAVQGILCADALTIEDGADFEGGICSTAERISVLKDTFAATEAYTMAGLPLSDEPPSEQSSQSSDSTDGAVHGDVAELPPSESGELDPPVEAERVVPANHSSSVPPDPDIEKAPADDAQEGGDGAANFSELEW
jgi:cytoskeletal protein CcmA (bactofilin family)